MRGGREERVVTVHHWTGLEAKALRLALRLSVRAFAEQLGLAVATVSKWEAKLTETMPRPDTQAILDTTLGRADASVHLRFTTFLSELASRGKDGDRRCGSGSRPRTGEYESWADDLDRAVVALSRQDFTFAHGLLNRWLSRCHTSELDDEGLYLFGRSTALLGDLRRDQGVVHGPLSALRCYADARAVFAQLGSPRRVAQMDLSLAVIAEMTGELHTAARAYASLAVDDRLSPRDRARARLWVGTAVSKIGHYDDAIPAIRVAIAEFERLTEPDDWSVAHQKLALARRGAGDVTQALRLIDVARDSSADGSPMQRVRLDAAHGHILLTDPATRDDGRRVLERAARVAAQYGLVHQRRSIEGITAASYGATGSAQWRPGREA